MNNAKKENNRKVKRSRDLFEKIEDIKGTFNVRIGTIKDRNGEDLTEAKEIKKRWQECREKLYQKEC